MMVINLCEETIKITQYQIYHISLGNVNISEMKVISSLLIEYRFIFCIYIMDEVIKEVYQSNFGPAYEVFKEAVKRIMLFDFRM